MSSDWLNNTEAHERVKRLLLKAGLPLENRVSQICQEFTRYRNTKGVGVEAQRVVYGEQAAGESLREVDQCVTFYKEFRVREQIGFQFILQVPIECKHRDNLEVFGFPYQDSTHKLAAYPVMSDLVGAALVRHLGYHEPQVTEDEPLSTIGLLEIDEGSTPRRVSDESLIYKAGAALYDFIKFDADGFGFSTEETDSLVVEMGLLERFQNYLEEKHYVWRYVLSDWLADLPPEVCREFSSRHHSSRALNTVSIGFPIVCVDAPLYLVSLAGDGDIKSFTPKDILLTGIRIPGWPGQFRYHLARPAPEALVTVTNVGSLPHVLAHLAEWYDSLVSALIQAESRVVERALAEAWLFRSVVSVSTKENHSSESYRSDFDSGVL